MDRKENVLLIGYGKYGEHVAHNLSMENFNLFIADSSKEALKRAREAEFEHVLVVDIENDAQLADILFDYNIDIIFCTFDDEEKNIYLTITLKALMKHLKVIAICESKESERKLKLAGADRVIDAMIAASNRLYFMLERPAVAEAIDHILFKDQSLTFKEITIPPKSFLDGKNINEIDFSSEYNIIVLGIVDKELGHRFIFVTRGINHKLDAGDILVVIGKVIDIKNFEEMLYGEKK